tara:strand:+ start:797 stop:2206 length:1410 start_codon:yes stop_codon:yes gene_type:complete
MNYLLNKNYLNLIIFSFIFILGFYSYSSNGLKVTSEKWFNEHQIDSEQMVLDGLLNGRSNGKLNLGVYLRNIDDSKDYLNAREYFLNKNNEGEFRSYESSYGFQVRIFHKLYNSGFDSLLLYHSIVSVLLSLIVAFMTLTIKRDFSTVSAVIFGFVFILSPWIVVFARNLFWVPFTWFIPIAISMYFSIDIFKNSMKFFLMLILIFFSFTLKFLCGYEFITTIFFATCVPIFYQGIFQNYKILQILKKCFYIGLIFITAFLATIIFDYKSNNYQDLGKENPILVSATKRLWSKNPELIAKKICNQDEICKEEIYKSLKSNPILVILKYLLMVDFLPWFYSNDVENETKNEIKEIIKKINKDLSFYNLKVFFKDIKNILSFEVILLIMIKSLSLISFLFFIFYLFYIFLYSTKPFKYLFLISLLAPISWYILAKGHSSIHLHMNFVLWYITFIPCGILSIINYHSRKVNK